ncbi:MAG: insulinase family protein [Blastochloris sp.]|nr:insulinase family protein [Blastochloris sp.]
MLRTLSGSLGGATYAFCPMDEVESISVGLWFGVGSRYETAGLQGGAHFLEHMLFKGTRKRSALMLSQEVESRGGDLNAFTSEEMTCYYARIDAAQLELALDVLFDMLWHSKLEAGEMEKERG